MEGHTAGGKGRKRSFGLANEMHKFKGYLEGKGSVDLLAKVDLANPPGLCGILPLLLTDCTKHSLPCLAIFVLQA